MDKFHNNDDEEWWPDYKVDNKKQKDELAGSFLPLNHRRPASDDPNFGWGSTNNNNEVEMITIIPNSRGGSFLSKQDFA